MKKAVEYAEKNGLILTEDMVFSEKEPASNTNDSPMVSDFTIVFKHRPELLKILTMASRKEFSHLIVYSSDRLARDVFQNALIKHHLEKYKIQIHFTKEGENFKNDSLSQKLQNIIACFAEFEASTNSTRVYDSLTQVFKKGAWTGGKRPFGFKLKQNENQKGKVLDIDGTKIEIIRLAFELYSKGYGYRKIADILSKEYPPYEFNKSTIEYILNNEIYCGILTWGKKGGRRKNRVKNDDYLKADYNEKFDIVGKDLLTLTNLQKNIKPTIKDPQYFSSPFILKDLLICSKCNGEKKLVPKNYGKDKTSVYKCPTKENSKSHNIVKAKEVEKLVLEELGKVTFSQDKMSIAYKKYISLFKKQIKELEYIKDNLEAKISYLQKNISNIDEMLSKNPEEHVEYGLAKYKRYFQDKISLLSNQLKEKISLISTKPIPSNEFYNEVHEIAQNIPDKRLLCFLLIDKILVSNEDDKVTLDIFIYPKTLKYQVFLK
ncbi:recombinase family protein [Clostridium sp. BSD9I1]|uniref:recombinase family protein n=1 Tax=Clostridium sp. BSD9I1 TaxID=2003589 RepID=UPI001FA8415F|nr:recombinase family protein [Clostridium sp. BSD9I1]